MLECFNLTWIRRWLMNRSGFWVLFHEAWGKDSARELDSDGDYDKKAWMYVQDKIEHHEKDKIAKTIRSATNS